MSQLIGAILRGLRARALLSAGSVLLAALAIGSAVLGPIFSQAVTTSYVITRLQETAPALTGLSRVFTPDADGSIEQAERDARAAAAILNKGPWQEPVLTVQSEQLSALRGVVTFWSRADACGLLDVEGRCPEKLGEVLMLAADLETTGAEIGQPLPLVIYEPGGVAGLALPRPGIDDVVVVGTYTTPKTGADWLIPGRLTSTNEQVREGGGYQPYAPAPLITTPETVTAAGKWAIGVETHLDAAAGLTTAQLDEAADSAAALPRDATLKVEGGTIRDEGVNSLASVAADVRFQQATARNSIAPAVLSLVLVALALLMRLLSAATELRVPELALASLRGVTARRLWVLGLAEPVVVLLLASPIGVAFGLGLSWVLVRAWLTPGLAVPLPLTSWLSALLVLLAAFAVACVAVGLVVRESLVSQLSGVRRPVTARRWSVVAQLTLVALAIATLVSKLSARGPAKPDATDLVLPVLLAVVAGLIATRLTAALATWWTRRSQGRSLSGFVSSRAISRRQEGTLVILPITAAIAVAVFGAGVYDSAATWRTSVAATAAPAHTVWSTQLTLSEAIDLTRKVDPEGEWVMAAADAANPGASFSIVDSSRLAQVSTWPETWSPGLSVEQVVEAIAPDGVVPSVTGRRISITVDNQAESDQPLSLEVRFGTRGGKPLKAYLGPFPQGVSTRTEAVPECKAGCPFEGMTLGGGAGTTMQMKGTLRVIAVEMDGQPVQGGIDGADWTPTPNPGIKSSIVAMRTEDGEVVMDVDTGDSVGMARITSGGISPERRALMGPKVQQRALAKLDEGYGLIKVDPIAEIEGMPFTGPSGLLVDYSSFITDRPVYNNLMTVRVLQRDGAPAAITDALSAAGLNVDTTLAQERQVLDQSAYALALRLYAIVAALVVLMALAGLFVSAAVQLPSRRRDAAALRVVGVPRRAVMGAVTRELLVVLGSAALAGIAAGSLAQWVVLRTITLGYASALTTPALVASISPVRLVVLTLLTAAVFGAAAFVNAAFTVRGARGSTLRESAR